MVSIHAPRAGRDRGVMPCSLTSSSFNPRAPCGARPLTRALGPSRTAVSIHAPRAGRDATQALAWAMVTVVSIHAPRAGRDFYIHKIVSQGRQFQSTRPVRGATIKLAHSHFLHKCFNPRAPCGARLLGAE